MTTTPTPAAYYTGGLVAATLAEATTFAGHHFVKTGAVLGINALTVLEAKVLRALDVSAAGNGYDFGLLEDLDAAALGITGKQLGGVLTDLQNKGYVHIYEPVKVNGTYTVTQFELPHVDRT